MKKQLRRLRLKEGDIVVVRDEQTLEALITAAKGLRNIPNCPIVFTREKRSSAQQGLFAETFGQVRSDMNLRLPMTQNV
jgi:hypothetical protein